MRPSSGGPDDRNDHADEVDEDFVNDDVVAGHEEHVRRITLRQRLIRQMETIYQIISVANGVGVSINTTNSDYFVANSQNWLARSSTGPVSGARSKRSATRRSAAAFACC